MHFDAAQMFPKNTIFFLLSPPNHIVYLCSEPGRHMTMGEGLILLPSIEIQFMFSSALWSATRQNQLVEGGRYGSAECWKLWFVMNYPKIRNLGKQISCQPPRPSRVVNHTCLRQNTFQVPSFQHSQLCRRPILSVFQCCLLKQPDGEFGNCWFCFMDISLLLLVTKPFMLRDQFIWPQDINKSN